MSYEGSSIASIVDTVKHSETTKTMKDYNTMNEFVMHAKRSI